MRNRPSSTTIRQFVNRNGGVDFSYPEIGLSRSNDPVSGYDSDLNRVQLGQGEAVFQIACEAIRGWKMFPRGWASVSPGEPPVRQGEVVAMVINLFGLYWVNGCRIVYTFEEKGETKKYGFAYGTLPSHIEKGEERFSVEMLPDGSVWYDLRAFSRPRLWLVKLGYPVARMLQRRFVRESLQAMQRAVWEGSRKQIEAEIIKQK